MQRLVRRLLGMPVDSGALTLTFKVPEVPEGRVLGGEGGGAGLVLLLAMRLVEEPLDGEEKGEVEGVGEGEPTRVEDVERKDIEESRQVCASSSSSSSFLSFVGVYSMDWV